MDTADQYRGLGPAIVNGEELEALWAHVFHADVSDRQQRIMIPYKSAPLVLGVMRPQPKAILLCVDSASDRNLAAHVASIRRGLGNPLTPILIINKDISPEAEVFAFRELCAFDYFTFPPTDTLLRSRLSDAAAFYDATFAFRLQLRHLGFDAGLSCDRLRNEVWSRQHDVVVLGGDDECLAAMLDGIPGVKYRFARRAPEVHSALAARPDLIIAGPEVIGQNPEITAYLSRPGRAPVIGITRTHRLESIIRFRLEGYDDVIVQSAHHEITQERVRRHLALNALMQMSVAHTSGRRSANTTR